MNVCVCVCVCVCVFLLLHFSKQLCSLFTGTKDDPDVPEEKMSPVTTLVVGVVVSCGAVIILTLVVIIGVSRKRARGITWFPEGFFSRGSDTSKPVSRRGPDGEEMK